jgi:hypothetical protein
MTEAEKELIEGKFNSLGELVEVKLNSSVQVICEKICNIENQFNDSKQKLNNHIDWHNTLNRRIVGGTIKFGVGLLIIVACISIFLGFKDGTIMTIIAKII